MANGETAVKNADANGTAGDVAEAYDAYKQSMENAGQKPKSLKDLLGR